MSRVLVYKMGFPADTPEDAAHTAAMDGCAAHLAAEGWEPAGEMIARTEESDAHRAAGEYLVRVDVERRRPGDRPPPVAADPFGRSHGDA